MPTPQSSRLQVFEDSLRAAATQESRPTAIRVERLLLTVTCMSPILVWITHAPTTHSTAAWAAFIGMLACGYAVWRTVIVTPRHGTWLTIGLPSLAIQCLILLCAPPILPLLPPLFPWQAACGIIGIAMVCIPLLSPSPTANPAPVHTITAGACGVTLTMLPGAA